MSVLKQETIDNSVHKWDEVLEYLRADGDKTYGFLQLAESDLATVTGTINCPYCRKQMVTEVRLLGIALQFSKLAGEWELSKGLRKKFSLIGKAVPLIARLTFLEVTKIL